MIHPLKKLTNTETETGLPGGFCGQVGTSYGSARILWSQGASKNQWLRAMKKNFHPPRRPSSNFSWHILGNRHTSLRRPLELIVGLISVGPTKSFTLSRGPKGCQEIIATSHCLTAMDFFEGTYHGYHDFLHVKVLFLFFSPGFVPVEDGYHTLKW